MKWNGIDAGSVANGIDAGSVANGIDAGIVSRIATELKHIFAYLLIYTFIHI